MTKRNGRKKFSSTLHKGEEPATRYSTQNIAMNRHYSLQDLQDVLIREILTYLNPQELLKADCCCRGIQSMGKCIWRERYLAVHKTALSARWDECCDDSVAPGYDDYLKIKAHVCSFYKASETARTMEQLAPKHGATAREHPCLECPEYPLYLDSEPIEYPAKFKFFVRMSMADKKMVLWQGFVPKATRCAGIFNGSPQLVLDVSDPLPLLAPWDALKRFLDYFSTIWPDYVRNTLHPPLNLRPEWRSAIFELTSDLAVTVIAMMSVAMCPQECSLVVASHRPSSQSRVIFYADGVDIPMKPELVDSHLRFNTADRPTLHRLYLRIKINKSGRAMFGGIVVRSNKRELESYADQWRAYGYY